VHPRELLGRSRWAARAEKPLEKDFATAYVARTTMRLALICAALALFRVAAMAQTNAPIPPKHVDLAVPLTAAASREAANAGNRVASLKAVVNMPANFDPRRPWPVLLVCAPSGSSAVGAARWYTNTACAAGWVVIAVDGPKVAMEQDNNVFAWAMIQSLLTELRRNWPQSKQWPFAVGGFSGGAKRSAMVAAEMARQGDYVIGVFMGGCNEDRASVGVQVARPPQTFFNVPMFLSNGSADPIAGPAEGKKVKDSMEATGFRSVRLETFDGGHKLDTNHLAIALEWFRPTTAPVKSSKPR
jgi:predicted esterase